MTTPGPQTDALEAQASAAEYRLLLTLDALAEKRRHLTETLHAARETLHSVKIIMLAVGAVSIATMLTVFVAKSLKRLASRP